MTSKLRVLGSAAKKAALVALDYTEVGVEKAATGTKVAARKAKAGYHGHRANHAARMVDRAAKKVQKDQATTSGMDAKTKSFLLS